MREQKKGTENEQGKKTHNKKIENHVAHGATHRHHQQIIWMDNKIPIIYEFISSWALFFTVAAVAVGFLLVDLFFFSR